MLRIIPSLRWLALAFLGQLTSAAVCCAAIDIHQPPCTYHYSQRKIFINGSNATVEYYVPDGRGTFPLVFMLHSSAGAYSVTSSREPASDNFGEKSLARNCFVVVLPHYLEAFGIKSMISTSEMEAQFPRLLAVVDSLLTGAESLPTTKGEPVFLFGESLGGYLSIALGLRREEVAAVSEISGGLPRGYTDYAPRPLSVLISHGEDDTLVPDKNAADLKDYCLSHHIRVQMNLYPKTGHYMPRSVEDKCITATIEFFLGISTNAVTSTTSSQRRN